MSSRTLPRLGDHEDLDAGGAPSCGQLLLDADGTIARCDTNAVRLFRAPESALLGRHVSALFPRLAAEPDRNEWPTPRTMYLSHCDIPFRAFRGDGEPFVTALYFNPLADDAAGRILLLVREVGPWPPRSRTTADPTGSRWCLE